MRTAKNIKDAARQLRVAVYELRNWKKQGCEPLKSPPPYDVEAISRWHAELKTETSLTTGTPLFQNENMMTAPKEEISIRKEKLEMQKLSAELQALKLRWYKNPTLVASLIATLVPTLMAVVTVLLAWKTGTISRLTETAEIASQKLSLDQTKLEIQQREVIKANEAKKQELSASVAELEARKIALAKSNYAIEKVTNFSGAYFDVDDSSMVLKFDNLQLFNINRRVKLLNLFQNLRYIPDLTGLECPSFCEPEHLRLLVTLPQLRTLKLSEASKILTSDIVKTISTIKTLRDIDLEGCTSLSQENFASLASLELESLNLSGCKISAEMIAYIAAMDTLKSLKLDRCGGLNEECLAIVGDMRSLRSLSLRDNSQLSDSAIEPLLINSNLEEIDLRGTGLSYAGIKRLLARSPAFRVLSRDRFALHDLIEEHQGNVSAAIRKVENIDLKPDQLGQIASIDLSRTDCVDSEMKYVSELPGLKRVVLSRRQTDEAVSHIRNSSSIEHVDLSYSKTSNDCFQILVELPVLEEVVLSRNMDDEALRSIKKVKKLRNVDAKAARVTRAAADAFKSTHRVNVFAINSRGASQLLGDLNNVGVNNDGEVVSLVVDKYVAEGSKQLASLPSLVYLQSLTLKECDDLDSEALRHVSALENLEEISIVGCKGIQDRALEYLPVGKKLRTLSVADVIGSRTSITFEGLFALKRVHPHLVINFKN